MGLETQPRPISATTDAIELNTPVARHLSEWHRIVRYLVVGSVGFLVDAGLLALQFHMLGIGPFIARGPSFLSAVTVTWWLNREYTFGGLGEYSMVREYRRYFLIQMFGALTNLAVYAVAIASVAWLAKYPVAAVALGSVFGLIVNYGLARHYVFPEAQR